MLHLKNTIPLSERPNRLKVLKDSQGQLKLWKKKLILFPREIRLERPGVQLQLPKAQKAESSEGTRCLHGNLGSLTPTDASGTRGT